MFTTFHDRTESSISRIVRQPLVAIWAAVAIAGIVFITLGTWHASNAERAAASAVDAKLPSSGGN
jgi:hypothetical protein